ncbi:MAG: DHH family phosphoesterase [Gammaproteobacteria bacterium]|nr:DHH family phosphoesterase [Gammaproteobacteria bacterium]
MFETRLIDTSVFAEARSRGLDPLTARIISGRITSEDSLDSILNPQLKNIAPPSALKDIKKATDRLRLAITNGEYIGIVTDYDADGLTSHAIITYALLRFGVSDKQISHWIGHRLEDGYGISETLVDRLLKSEDIPDVVISADCGSSDELQIARLKNAGIDVVITDHHRVSEDGPPQSAYAVVNPNRTDCLYPDKAIAGCLVSWLVMGQLRQELVDYDVLDGTTPKLGDLLDYVALGTVADSVSLGSSETNRAVVKVGLTLIASQERPCWQVAISHLTSSPKDINAELLAFQLAPRLNARGRIGHSLRGYEYLSASSVAEATNAFMDLDADNKKRRKIEKAIFEQAKPLARRQRLHGGLVLCVVLEHGHPGVQGIVASRIVEIEGLPTIVFTAGNVAGTLTGSMRSIPDVDAKALLDQVNNNLPGALIRYGGHTGACGMTIPKEALAVFSRELQEVYRQTHPTVGPKTRFLVDGELLNEQLNIGWVEHMESLGPFGRGFDQPLFIGIFQVVSARLVGQDLTHLSLRLRFENREVQAIWFSALESSQPAPVKSGDWIKCIYSVSINTYRGQEVSLTIRHGELEQKGNIHV